jgi:hypothetical protein
MRAFGLRRDCYEMRVSMSTELPLYRLYLLRGLYALIGVAQGLQTWPAIVHHAHPWDFWHGVAMSFLGALTALALLGIRYPVRMIPLLFFEFAWKFLWMVVVWLPVTLSHALNADVADNAFAMILGVVLVPLVLPWGYVWKNYVVAPGDRWR